MSKKEKEEVIVYDHVVLYTDGSFIANEVGGKDGFYGSGVHGYVYNDKGIGKPTGDRPNKNRITTIGYIPEDVKLDDEAIQQVNPSYYIDGSYSYLNKGTNNIAEGRAVIDGINGILAQEGLNIKSITLLLDSQYILHIIQTLVTNNLSKEGWLHPELPNKELWLELLDLLIKLTELGIKVNTVKIKGHNGDVGNETADKLAWYARSRSCQREIERSFFIVSTKDRKYWSANDTRSPLIKFKQLFFTNTIRAKEDEIIYSILDYPSDVNPGTKTANSCFGLVLLNGVNDIIEDVIKAYHRLGWANRRFNIISTCDLNNLYTRSNLHWYNMFGSGIYRFDYKSHRLKNIEGVPLIDIIRPGGLAVQALENMKKLYNILKDYRRFKEVGDDKFKIFTNITSTFYNIVKNKKEEDVYESKLTPSTDIVKIPVTIGNTTYNIPLELGKDVVSKNHIKSLEKFNPEIYLVLEKRDSFVNYYTIVECNNGDIGIYCNLYSGRILL